MYRVLDQKRPTKKEENLSRQYTLRAPARPENPGNGSKRSGTFPRRGGFSPRQQAIYRTLVDKAWRAVCKKEHGKNWLYYVGDGIAKNEFYRETLRDKLGVYTSKQLNKTGDFEKACAAFEEIAGNDIYWQLRVQAGPVERARRELKHLIATNEIDENYVDGVAKQMFKTNASNLNAGQLNDVIVALKTHFKEHRELEPTASL